MVWQPNPERARAPAARRAVVAALPCAALLCATAACALSPAALTLAAAPDAANQGRLDASVRYLQDVQHADGGFPGSPGAPSSPGFSAWIALALAAAGVNPQDQAPVAGPDVYTYLTTHARELSDTTDFERALLVADAAGATPHDFGGVDLAARILARQDPSGAIRHDDQRGVMQSTGVNDAVFAILALSPIAEPAVSAAVARAADWLTSTQLPDGSWGDIDAHARVGDVDMTGAALEALNAAERHDTPAQLAALRFLHAAQNPDGGFPAKLGDPSNVASTAWAVQGLWAAHLDPRATAWMRGGVSPLDYMASLQQPSGLICWTAADCTSYPIWMTAYAAPAFAGYALPLAAVPRSVRTHAAAAPPAPPSGTPAAGLVGSSGAASTPGRGVIAGGGGRGAKLFSRPKPQSQGTSAGGVRRTRAIRSHARVRHKGPAARPGSNGRRAAAASRRRGTPAGDRERGQGVRGVLIGGAPATTSTTESRVVLAAGLRSAQAGGRQGSAGVLALAGMLVLALAGGAGLEHRRLEPV
ncbi:MAG TPA: prenyltransferase/squalene oxidase repeat-containing protein [Solirubrobacteraceae bacterium]|nr:prenyltransferase/squalene oxidase repeat-containing protein [Solirubrobacteraceae bacterium]